MPKGKTNRTELFLLTNEENRRTGTREGKQKKARASKHTTGVPPHPDPGKGERGEWGMWEFLYLFGIIFIGASSQESSAKTSGRIGKR